MIPIDELYRKHPNPNVLSDKRIQLFCTCPKNNRFLVDLINQDPRGTTLQELNQKLLSI